MRRPLLFLGVAHVLFLLAATNLAAQNRTCDLIDSRLVNSVTERGGRVSHVSLPRFLCTDGTRIEADSSVTFEANSFTQLFGNVLFRDGTQELEAERAQYFSRAGRLQAQGSVRLTDMDDSSTITGENLVMLQEEDERPEDDVTIRGGRPHARFFSKAVPVSDSLQANETQRDGVEIESPLPDTAAGLPPPANTLAGQDVPSDTLEVEPSDTVEVEPSDTLEVERPDTVEVEPSDTLEVEPPDTVEVEPPEIEPAEVEAMEPEPPPGPPMPFDVDADLIRLVGDRLFQARGRVVVWRDSLLSYGDSMEYQQDVGTLTLFRNARILSPDAESGDTLDVRGDTIDMRLPSNRIDELEARGHAQLVTDALDMKGPILRIFFAQEELDRIVSVMGGQEEEVDEEPPPQPAAQELEDSLEAEMEDPFARPQATAEDFLLTGDSIEVKTPGGELESVFASGQAHGVSSVRDSLNTEDAPDLIRHDWIEGETITATFGTSRSDSAASPAGTTEGNESRYRLDKLVAQGAARSFYRSAPDSSSTPGGGQGPLELNYVLGDEIRLFMKDGEVDRMEVDDATGAYFQPQPGFVTPAADTVLPPPPDTTSTPRGQGNLPQESRTNERLRSGPRNR